MIQLEDLHKRYGEKLVLDGLTLAVRPGETMVILGASGSGKSVTLRHVIGLTRPDRGRVVSCGEEIQDLPEEALTDVRRKIGFLFQGGALFDSMNVFDNLAFPLREAGWGRERVEERVAEVLGLVDLDPVSVRDLMPSSLSGGMRKRVALARAIAVTPVAILYDEPTTGLDPITAKTINQLIVSMQERLQVTSIVVTHDIVSAFHVGDRIAFLHEGKIRFLGTTQQARASQDPLFSAFIRGGVLETNDGA
ncbi:MAG: ATP-binding cassette domain-containing protein [Acidobacteriota bacterium]|nr:MAG: ATP-binding cassette domain-containing protein [Acidobacteriota bacterium]